MNWAIEEKSYSQRRACGLVGLAPKTFRYVSKRPDDADLRGRLKELPSERRRFGYRRLHILLKREGVELNHKKLFRLYREERLTVRRRGGRKRALGTRAPMAIPLPMIPGVYAYKTILALMQFMQENQDTATMNRLIVEICKNGITAFFIIFSLVIGVAIPMLMFKRLSYTRIIKPEH